MMVLSGLAFAISTTDRMWSTAPGLKDTWIIPSSRMRVRISVARSREGIPAAMVMPSTGSPSRSMTSIMGYSKPQRYGLRNSRLMVIPSPGRIMPSSTVIRFLKMAGVCWPPPASSPWKPAFKQAEIMFSDTVQGVMPAIITGGLPSTRVKRVSIIRNDLSGLPTRNRRGPYSLSQYGWKTTGEVASISNAYDLSTNRGRSALNCPKATICTPEPCLRRAVILPSPGPKSNTCDTPLSAEALSIDLAQYRGLEVCKSIRSPIRSALVRKSLPSSVA
mmetsp:Transcript_40374/g.65413  ORF Transcript_40374/g.65413 Transcript_40374/m.65413 type:complete len:276 (-) Transcript_40374:1444-2271(-)